MEIVPFRLTANFQADLSLSEFLERFSVGSSETSCIIRLFKFGVPEPLGTHVDRGSAVDPIPWLSVQGFLGPNPWLLSFLQIYLLRNHFGSSLRHVLLSRLGIGVLDLCKYNTSNDVFSRREKVTITSYSLMKLGPKVEN